MNLKSLLIALSAFLPTYPDAAAQTGSPADRAQIVREFAAGVPFLKKRFDGNSTSTAEHPVVLIVTDESSFLRSLQLNDPAIILMPQADVVAAQLASFASLSGLEIEGDHAVMKYEIPASDRTGEMRFTRSAGQWKKRSRNESRSLASARGLYGRLYAGAVCRDGTEMAYRWNYLASRRAERYAGTCPGTEFPDVGVYRQQLQQAGK